MNIFDTTGVDYFLPSNRRALDTSNYQTKFSHCPMVLCTTIKAHSSILKNKIVVCICMTRMHNNLVAIRVQAHQNTVCITWRAELEFQDKNAEHSCSWKEVPEVKRVHSNPYLCNVSANRFKIRGWKIRVPREEEVSKMTCGEIL
jgi:hypothetical protein